MSDKYVLALDQGSTTTKSLLLNLKNPLKPEIISQASVAIKTKCPQNSWVEHDLEDIWRSVIQSIDLVLKRTQKKNTDQSSSCWKGCDFGSIKIEFEMSKNEHACKA